MSKLDALASRLRLLAGDIAERGGKPQWAWQLREAAADIANHEPPPQAALDARALAAAVQAFVDMTERGVGKPLDAYLALKAALLPAAAPAVTDARALAARFAEPSEILPRLEVLSNELCQTNAFILRALERAGLAIVPMASLLLPAPPAETAELEALKEAARAYCKRRDEAPIMYNRDAPLDLHSACIAFVEREAAGGGKP